MTKKTEAAAELGRSRSPRKTAACRKNSKMPRPGARNATTHHAVCVNVDDPDRRIDLTLRETARHWKSAYGEYSKQTLRGTKKNPEVRLEAKPILIEEV